MRTKSELIEKRFPTKHGEALLTEDPSIGALYLYLAPESRDDGPVAKTESINDNVNLDFDGDGKLIGIEIIR